MQEALEALRDEIEAACAGTGRSREEVTLIAVSKTFPAAAIREAHELGLRDFGENRVQELTAKAEDLRDLEFRWHLIGPLQTNKVRAILPHLGLLHSLDRIDLAREISRRAVRPIEALIQVNTTAEKSKSGVEPEGLAALLDALEGIPSLTVRGLMTIGPLGGDERSVRTAFATLRSLREREQARRPELDLAALSMGMSGDFAWAIAEGATHLRIGSRIFGRR
ncbi:MAG: YggS family pyridoxal phosphate-dependent enzyme [Candidatus Eisenbacteria bacterium]|nr:YggS family pyridoxal phosphate-dependent enzyme [Candidatus Eisenbacteria bacterium]